MDKFVIVRACYSFDMYSMHEQNRTERTRRNRNGSENERERKREGDFTVDLFVAHLALCALPHTLYLMSNGFFFLYDARQYLCKLMTEKLMKTKRTKQNSVNVLNGRRICIHL